MFTGAQYPATVVKLLAKVYLWQHLITDFAILQSIANRALRRIMPRLLRVTQTKPNRRSERLLDQFRDKIRILNYALATEKSYRHWIVEFLRFHRVSGEWRHPADMGKPEIEVFLTHLAIGKQKLATSPFQLVPVSTLRFNSRPRFNSPGHAYSPPALQLLGAKSKP